MACTRKNKKIKYCISDFRTPIRIIDPSIEPADESYSVDNTNFIWKGKAICKTSSGVQNFNGVNTDNGITHTFIIRYTSTLIEKRFMILLRGEFLVVDSVENINEENRYLKIRCKKRGSETFQANQF